MSTVLSVSRKALAVRLLIGIAEPAKLSVRTSMVWESARRSSSPPVETVRSPPAIRSTSSPNTTSFEGRMSACATPTATVAAP